MTENEFDPHDWYWVVGDDVTKYWSSSANSYVMTLPENSGVTKIKNEHDLNAVLFRHGLPGPIVTADDVKSESARRMMLIFNQPDRESLENLIRDAMQEATSLLYDRLESQASNGDWSDEQSSRAAELRQYKRVIDNHDASSKALRAMNPIPDDFRDDQYWI